MNSSSNPPVGLTFGRFRVLPERREVLADGRPVKLGGRAFDVLMAPVEARGAVVGKHALMARVWPGRIIEENSLAAQIAALRAAFGAERALIRTISRRGSQFTGEIREMPQPNQIARKRQDVHVTAADLLEIQKGMITEAGLRQNLNVGIGYIEAWQRGIGCVPLYHPIEDTATAEVSRAP